MFGRARLISINTLTANEYRAEVPATKDAGTYDVISGSTGSVTLRFTVPVQEPASRYGALARLPQLRTCLRRRGLSTPSPYDHVAPFRRNTAMPGAVRHRKE